MAGRAAGRRTSIFCLIGVALAVLSGGLAPVGAEQATPVPPSPISVIEAGEYCPDSQEWAFLSLINDYRGDHGLPALKLSRTLGAAAEDHSRDMASNDYFSHSLSDGRTWLQNIRAHGYGEATALGENIAAGHSSAEETFEQFVDSESHRENMLNADYAAIGIGRASDPDSTFDWYWTTTFGGYADEEPAC